VIEDKSQIRNILVGMAVAILVILVGYFLDREEISRHHEIENERVYTQLMAQRDVIQSQTYFRLSLASSLAILARHDPEGAVKNFKSLADELLNGVTGIRSLQLAPDGIVQHVYPLSGNEAAIGHNLLADPKHKNAVEAAIAEKRMMIAGPYLLRQGGLGLVGRIPIYSLADDKFWGLAIVVVDLPAIFDAAGVGTQGAEMIHALRIKGDSNRKNEVFFGPASLFERNPAALNVSILGSSWEMAALPASGWSNSWPGRYWLASITLLFAALLGWTSYKAIGQALQLRESEARFHATFSSAFNIVAIVDPLGKIIDANQAFSALLPETNMNLSLWDYAGWKENVEILKQQFTVANQCGLARFEITYCQNIGKPSYFDFTLKTIQGAFGAPSALLLLEGRDVTERRISEEAVREREDMYRQMFMSNKAMKLLIDPSDGQIIDANPSALAYYGYSRETLLGLRISDINMLPPDQVAEEMSAAKGEERTYFRFPHRLASGEIRHVEVYSGPVRLGGRQLLHSIIHDITNHDLYKEQIEQSHAELEQLVKIITNDLRDPLHTIRLYLQMLSKRFSSGIDKGAVELLSFAENSAERMDALVSDLAKLSQIGKSDNEPENINLRETIGRAWRKLRIEIERSNAELSVPNENLPVIFGNVEEFTILFQNLIAHAIASCRPKEAPHIVIEATPLRQEWEISVSFNGVDMEIEDLGSAFNLFGRLDKDGRMSGTGIGLAICKKVVEQHDGHIRLESFPGQGCRFNLNFPHPPAGIST
jgi:PAS domain S-box-containing protein